MIFHARGAGGGTVYLDGDKASLLPIRATYPAWHPGGRYVAFDSKGTFSDEPCTVWRDDSASVSFPRVKGDRIMFTKSSYGTFPIWHREADLWTLDISTGKTSPGVGLNSDDTESYHSWSSNGRWVVFSSRRLDGRYSRLFISHCNDDGSFTKPFLLPQRTPDHNTLRLKSYNIPEFVTSEVPDRHKSISKLFDR